MYLYTVQIHCFWYVLSVLSSQPEAFLIHFLGSISSKNLPDHISNTILCIYAFAPECYTVSHRGYFPKRQDSQLHLDMLHINPTYPIVALLLIIPLSCPVHAKKLAFKNSTDIPVVHRSIASQISPNNTAINPYISSDDSVLPLGLWVPPGWSFSIGLLWDTFLWDGGRKRIKYVASLRGGDPLPPWIKFDSPSMTFDGISPRAYHYQTLEIDVYPVGFPFISESFNLTVAKCDFALLSRFHPLNLTADTAFAIKLNDVILPGLLLDGKPLNLNQGKMVKYQLDASSPSWISYDPVAETIRGVPPSKTSTVSSSIIVVVADVFNNQNSSLHAEIPFSVEPSYFKTPQIDPIIAKSNHPVDFDFAPYSVKSSGYAGASFHATFEPKNTTDWFTLSGSPPRLLGTIPPFPNTNHVNVTVTATSVNTNATSITSLYISISPSTSAGPDNSIAKTSHHSLTKPQKLGLSLTFGIIGAFALLCCVLACVRKQVSKDHPSRGIRPGPRGRDVKEYVVDQSSNSLNAWNGMEKGDRRTSGTGIAELPAALLQRDKEELESHSRAYIPQREGLYTGVRSPVERPAFHMPSMIPKVTFFNNIGKPPRPYSQVFDERTAGPTGMRKISSATIASIKSTLARFKPVGPRPGPISKPILNAPNNTQRPQPGLEPRYAYHQDDSILGLEAGGDPFADHASAVHATSDMSIEGGVSLRDESSEGHDGVARGKVKTSGSKGSGRNGGVDTSSSKGSDRSFGMRRLPALEIGEAAAPQSSTSFSTKSSNVNTPRSNRRGPELPHVSNAFAPGKTPSLATVASGYSLPLSSSGDLQAHAAYATSWMGQNTAPIPVPPTSILKTKNSNGSVVTNSSSFEKRAGNLPERPTNPTSSSFPRENNEVFVSALVNSNGSLSQNSLEDDGEGVVEAGVIYTATKWQKKGESFVEDSSATRSPRAPSTASIVSNRRSERAAIVQLADVVRDVASSSRAQVRSVSHNAEQGKYNDMRIDELERELDFLGGGPSNQHAQPLPPPNTNTGGNPQPASRKASDAGQPFGAPVKYQSLRVGRPFQFTIALTGSSSSLHAYSKHPRTWSENERLHACLSNGQDLPTWLHFDTNELEFYGSAPPAGTDGQNLQLRIWKRNAGGDSCVGSCEVAVMGTGL